MNHHVSFPSSGFREYVGSAWRGTTERDRTDGMAGRQTEKAKFDKERTMDELIGKLGSAADVLKLAKVVACSAHETHFSMPQFPEIYVMTPFRVLFDLIRKLLGHHVISQSLHQTIITLKWQSYEIHIGFKILSGKYMFIIHGTWNPPIFLSIYSKLPYASNRTT